MMRSRLFFWKCMSPTDSASSITSTSGSTAVAAAKAKRMNMPDE